MGIIFGSIIVLFVSGYFYSRKIAGVLGEDSARTTPAVQLNDGRDYVPTPTFVVMAHHFASIAGAGPILGPVIAVAYGWLPCLLWIVFGGVLIGAVHDYGVTYLSMREGGQSIAMVARRVLGNPVYVSFSLLIVMMLALLSAAFLNASATALVSMVSVEKMNLPKDTQLLRVVERDGVYEAVVGGIASTSVIVITMCAPLLGWLYLKKRVVWWLCSSLALVICCMSIVIGFFVPVRLDPEHWKWLISGYVLVSGALPVWLFLQSRDFINVHVLYLGMFILLLSLLGVGFGEHSMGIPMLNIAEAQTARGLGPIWPLLFVTIACGAVSGFHGLCASGTTCKQLVNESAARQVGYGSMLLESFLAVSVVAVLVLGIPFQTYKELVHPDLLGLSTTPNWILGFALAVSRVTHQGLGVPVWMGVVCGMLLLEGFVITTLDTSIRLMRYLLEEVWVSLFGQYDILFERMNKSGTQLASAPIATTGMKRCAISVLSNFWFNSLLAVALMLFFAFRLPIAQIWPIFASSNQALAGFSLIVLSFWLLYQSKNVWFTLIPAVFMVVTSMGALIYLLVNTLNAVSVNWALLLSILLLITITITILASVVRKTWQLRRKNLHREA